MCEGQASLGILRIYTCYPPDSQGIYHLLGHLLNPLTRVLICIGGIRVELMNKKIVMSVHSRLGYWIRYERKRLLELTNNPMLRQDKFILLNEDEHFFDFVPGETVCSRPILSRIENGKVVYEKSLIDFFLKRFGKKYRINDKECHLMNTTIQAFHVYLFENCKLDITYLSLICEDTNDKIEDNLLWDEDYILLKKLIKWYENFEVLSKIEFVEVIKKFRIYHESLKDIVIFYLCFSVYFNPELWTYNKDLKQLISEDYSSNELLTIFNDLFNNHETNVIRSFYRYRHLIKDDSFLFKFIQPIRMIFDNHTNYKKYHNLSYLCLIHKIHIKEYIANSPIELILFNYLMDHSIDESKNINELLGLIKDEPNPRILNKLVLQQIYPKIKSKGHMLRVLSFILE